MIDKILSDLDSKKTIIQKIVEAEKQLKLADDPEVKTALEIYLDDLRVFQVDLIQAVKDGEEFAFEKLLEVKDIRNFIYHYAWHIRKFFNFRYSEKDIVNEIKYQLFYTVRNNYRIYNVPNEISLLINSMRRWIKQKVGEELTKSYKPKIDNYLPHLNIEDESYDRTESWVYEITEKILSIEDQRVFKLRFFDGYGYKHIGLETGKSKDAVQRRYEKILKQIKGYLEGIGKWQQ